MREMQWNQYEYAEMDFYKDIDKLDEAFSETLQSNSIVSIRQFFWVERDYISPNLIKPVLCFNQTYEIPSNVIFAIGLTFSRHFLEW